MPQLTNEQQRTVPRYHIEDLVEYLWDKESRDYEQSSDEQRAGHIFESMEIVNKWLIETIEPKGPTASYPQSNST